MLATKFETNNVLMLAVVDIKFRRSGSGCWPTDCRMCSPQGHQLACLRRSR